MAPRRSWLFQAGDPLIAPHDPFSALYAASIFLEDTGIDELEELPDGFILVIDPISILPLIERLPNEDSTYQRFFFLDPALLWHPIFWLPEHLLHPYSYIEPGGSEDDVKIEPEEEWIARVLLELEETGLYDETTGTWTDVLAEHGIDVESASDRLRVRNWLQGGEDIVLDGIDLQPLFDQAAERRGDADWSQELAVAGAAAQSVYNELSYAPLLLEHLQNRGEGRFGHRGATDEQLAEFLIGHGAQSLLGISGDVEIADGGSASVADYIDALDTTRQTDPAVALRAFEGLLRVLIARLDALNDANDDVEDGDDEDEDEDAVPGATRTDATEPVPLQPGSRPLPLPLRRDPRH